MALSNEEIMLKERIQHLLKIKRYPIARLSDNPTLQSRYGRQINGDASVPFTTIQLILMTFHDISADWLIMGEGSMYKADHKAQKVYNTHNEVKDSTASGSINVGTTTIPYPVQQLLDEKDKRIAELESDKRLLKGMLEAFNVNKK